MTSRSFGLVTVIVPLTTAFRTVDPVCVTSTVHCTVPVSPCFMSSWLLSTDFSTSQL